MIVDENSKLLTKRSVDSGLAKSGIVEEVEAEGSKLILGAMWLSPNKRGAAFHKSLP
jgi:hypothetical protein